MEIYESFGRRLKYDYRQYEALRDAAAKKHEEWQLLQSEKGDDDPEVKLARLQFEAANLDIEDFDQDHDATGAWKKERFAADMAAPLDTVMDRPRTSETYLPEAEDPINPVFIINMGELDRLNSAGAHDLGDKGLGQAADFIRQTLESEGLADSFDLYRLSQNDFSVRLSKPVAKAEAMRLRDLLTRGVKDSPLRLPGQIEAPPLVADFATLEETASLLPEASRQGEDRTTLGIEALKDYLFAYNDVSKTIQRFKRLQAKLAEDEAGARKLFDENLKKSVSGAYGTPTFERFKEVAEELDGDDHEIGRRAVEYVISERYTAMKGKADAADRLTDWLIDKIQKEQGIKSEKKGLEAAEAKPLPPRPEQGPSEFVMPDPRTATRGLSLLNDRQAELEKMKAAGPLADPVEAQKVINYEKALNVERKKRDAATGFEQRGSMFRFLEQAYENNQATATVFGDLSFLKYFDKVGGKKTGDLAILKFAELMEQARAETVKAHPGLEIECYRLGGDEFSFAVRGQVKNREELENVNRELKDRLLEKIEKAGSIPQQEGAQAGYYDTKLSVGLGSHIFMSPEQGRQELADHGLSVQVDPDVEASYRQRLADDPFRLRQALASLDRNAVAEKQVLIADKIGEINKSFNRLKLLFEAKAAADMAPEGSQDRAVREAHYKQLSDFSQKAIFGATGTNQLLAWRESVAARPEKEREEAKEKVYEEMLAFVLHHHIEGKVHEREQGHEQERNLEFLIRFHFLETRERELETAIRELRIKYGIQSAKFKAAEAEKRAIVKLRAGIKAAPPAAASAAR